MSFFLHIFIIALLFAVAWSDIRTQTVPLYLLVVLLVLTTFKTIQINGLYQAGIVSVINLTGTFLVLLSSVLLLFIKKRALFNPVDSLIGSGDLLFFCCALPFFFPTFLYPVYTGVVNPDPTHTRGKGA